MEALQQLSSGHGLIEGPLFDPARGLIFTDVTNGGAYCLAADGKISVVVPHRKGMGGLAMHVSGGMIVSGRTIAYKPPGGGDTVNLIPDNPPGGILGFNDLVTDDAGRIYAGSLAGSALAEERPKSAFLHLVDLDGSHRVVGKDVHLTNGLGFSLDGKLLYHSDSGVNAIKLYDVAANGDLGPPRIFVTTRNGSPDGLAVASDGSVWIALAYGGAVLGYDTAGREIARIEVPARLVTSLCFGGSDWRDLYIVTGPDREVEGGSGCIYRTRMNIAGRPRPLARVRIT
ncbi:MAG: xylono-1,5-lactonase [Alphaproteobacteria bacterium]|nr:xylono-1,5-lactonase [Alphaproteobacteria bacterium]